MDETESCAICLESLDSDEVGVTKASSITQHQQLPGALAQEQDDASQRVDERTEEEELRPWQVEPAQLATLEASHPEKAHVGAVMCSAMCIATAAVVR